ncbi:hypothetical protein [Pseudomonas phage vB_PaeM_PS119XW]|uniref:Uncharacterized protein n=1 Tax=Pseudomonas phage vB_PaeM_PS119XW TaxID=2601632 RepID=A0A5C1K870_9CAUD|nr:hypothetical protein PP933_gp382 [Pseudomonas phage vB_PaeM_PS119XW]QEM42112.1 hypothetical protein [Pseudomonas phage vB_PaeM_PS119XW]
MNHLTPTQNAVYFTFVSPEFMKLTLVESFVAIHKKHPEVKHCVKKKISDNETQFIFIFKDGTDNLIVTRKTEPCPELDSQVGDRIKLSGEELKNILTKHGRPSDSNYFKHWTDRS